LERSLQVYEAELYDPKNVRRQALGALLKVLGEGGTVAVAPRGLDQDSPEMRIADFRNCAVAALISRPVSFSIGIRAL